MVMEKKIKSYKLLDSQFPPSPPIKDSKLYVLNQTTQKVEVYITDKLGNPKPLKDDVGIGVHTFFSSDNSISISGSNTLDLVLESSLKTRIENSVNFVGSYDGFGGTDVSGDLDNSIRRVTASGGFLPTPNSMFNRVLTAGEYIIKLGGVWYKLTCIEYADNQFKIFDNLDTTKKLEFDLGNISTGQTRKIIMPDNDVDLSNLGSEINDLTSSVTWANVPDINITESSVKQHEGALSISTAQLVGTIGTGNLANDIVTIDKVDSNIETSLGLADSALQSGDNISLLNNDSGYLTDAPSNGNEYVRLNGGWSVSSGGGLNNIVEDTTPQLGGDLDLNGNVINSISPIETVDTETEIFLTTSGGILSNYGTANSNTTFTEGAGKVLNGWNQIRINTASEPTVPVSWTQQGGIEWRTGDLFMIVRNTGATGVIYYYIPYDIQSSSSETATYSTTSTAVTTLDLDVIGDSHRQLLTVNTDIQWSNTPAIGFADFRTLEVSGAFSLTFTTSTKVIGTYIDDGTTVNIITVNFANYPTVGLRVTVMINQ